MATTWRRRAAICSALVLVAVVPVPDSRAAGAVPVELLRDINTTATGESPSHLTAVGTTLFFTQSTPLMGEELWKTNGTDLGTAPVKDINPGEASSDARALTAVDGTLYFFADDGEHGFELWKSDGSPEGTEMVKDINQGSPDSYADAMTVVGSTVFFGAYDGLNGWELWKSNGTEAGTAMVAEVSAPGPAGSNVMHLTEYADELYFSANDGVNGDELWRSNGTTVELVTDIEPGAGGSFPMRLEVVDLVPDGPTLFFEAYDTPSGSGLWRSDGTTTELVAATGPLTSEIVGVAGDLFFGAQGEMWTSDGTDEGTHEVKVDYPGAVDTFNPAHLTALNGKLMFRATNTSDPEIQGLWQTDGTDEGTVRLVGGEYSGYPDRTAVAFGGAVLFEIIGEGGGSELWTTDGTVPGTELLMDIRPGLVSSEPHELTVFDNQVYFVANDGVVEDELWRTDGTATGTELVKDVNPSTLGSGPDSFASIGNTVYFTAGGAAHGQEIWKSDGTAAGTVLAIDVLPGPDSSDAAELTAIGTTLYFTANRTAGDPERVLWKSDGTAAGTEQLPVPTSPNALSHPGALTSAGGLLYFAARANNGASLGSEPWRTDGTTAGTILLKDVLPGSGGGTFGGFSYVNGMVLFPARSSLNDMELWKTDGTAVGTTIVKDIRPGNIGSGPADFTAMGGATYFTADDGATGRTLWKTNGTEAGTLQVADPNPGSTLDETAQLTQVNARLFFTANDELPVNDPNIELWTSDGTTGGTHLVRDLGPAPVGSAPYDLTELGGALYFTADDDVNGRELWKSDGTAGGTTLVKDINPSGAGFTTDHSIEKAGGLLFLAADDGVHGSELWQSDGTSVGTELARDIRPGAGSGLPSFTGAAAALGQLFFSADDGPRGRELWLAGATLDTDLDDDGIANDIDTQPATSSAGFSDVGPLGGKTSGNVLGVTGGAGFTIVDAPTGVHITVTGAPNARVRVQIVGRPSSEKLPPGVYELDDPVWDTTLTVLAGGPAEIEAPLNGTLVVITVHEGASVTFTETVSSTGALTDLVLTPDAENPDGSVQVNGVDITADDVLAFGTFNPKLSRSRLQTTFLLSGTFTPGASSDGVQLPTENVSLSIGSYHFVLTAGSFPQSTGGSATTEVDGVTLTVQLKRLKRGAWEVQATVSPAVLINPVSVGLRIGDDVGYKTVKFR